LSAGEKLKTRCISQGELSMIIRSIAHLLYICGTLMMFVGVSMLPVPSAQARQPDMVPLLQPSPRPTLGPDSKSSDNNSQSTSTGRITGTIIDLTTGAPTPGIEVNIGGVMILSDSNGNYDLWVAAGPHSVALVLDPSHGTPAQGQQMVDVVAGATVILHLSFSSIAPPTATPLATSVAPDAISGSPPVATAEPTATQAAGASADTPPRSASVAHTRLPRTSEEPSSAWTWIALGMFLLLGGVALELGRNRLSPLLAGAARSVPGYENARLLAALLARRVDMHLPETTRTTQDELLLSALLATDIRDTER
jgi:hypothetical protein